MDNRVHTIPYDIESEPEQSSVSISSPIGKGPESEDRLLHIARVLREERRFLGKMFLWTGVITLVFALFLHNTYRSTVQLMPPDDQSGSKAGLAMMASMASKGSGGAGGGGSDIGLLAGDMLGMHTSGDLFIGILHSHAAQEGMVDRFDLTSVYGIPWLRIRAQKDDACKELDSNTETSQDRKSGIITISVVDRDPKRSAALANGYADQLNTLISKVSTSSARREREFLEQRLVEVKKELDQATTQLSQFSSKNTTFDPLVQGKATVEAVAGLEGQLIAAQSQLRGMQSIYMPENVRVRSLQARVSELKKQLDALSGSSDPGASSASDQDTISGMPFPSLRQMPLLGATYADLFRRVKIEETVFQVLTQQYEMAKVQEAKETPTVKVLDHGEVPPRKWGPHRAILALVGGIFGFLVGCLIVIGTDRWKNWDPHEPRKIFISETYAHLMSRAIVQRVRSRLRKVKRVSDSDPDPWPGNGAN